MKYTDVKYIYLLGIGGIGMSALARFFNASGCAVYGYDRVATQLTHALENEGCQIVYTDDAALLPEAFKQPAADNLVVFTPAVPASLGILQQLQARGFSMLKRAAVLGLISKTMPCYAVAGTHGKTTTTAMLAHILVHAGLGCTAFVGGVLSNYGTNFINTNTGIMVAEADEYDRSFLQLQPYAAVITSMDADHLDIYGTSNDIEEGFKAFAALVPTAAKVYYKQGLPLQGNSFSAAGPADITAKDLQITGAEYHFTYKSPQVEIKNIALPLPGVHNVNNALAAISLALLAGVQPAAIAPAMQSFRGIKRRFEYIINNPKQVFIDDYAHHPTEINALIDTVEALYPGQKITAVFQPHLFSRTKDFADEFAQALKRIHNVILLDIYPAREQPLPGINSQWLAEKTGINTTVLSPEHVINHISEHKPSLLLTIGAGDIDRLVEPLKQAIYA